MAAKKKEQQQEAKTVKLQVPAGEAKAEPPIGPVLGQAGVNIGDFISRFNSQTSNQEKGLLLPVVITVFPDRSFEFVVKKPPAALLIRKALGIEKGSGQPHVNKVGKLTEQQVREIAEFKLDELNTDDVGQAMRVIAGTARSMGVDVEMGGN